MEEKTSKTRLIKYSPVMVVIVCNLISIMFTMLLGVYAYTPVLLVYWGILFIFIIIKGDIKNTIKGWLQPAKGSRW